MFDYVYKFMPVRMSYRYFDRENNFKLIKLKNESKRKDCEVVYECIVSEQVPPDMIAKYFEDEKF